MSDLTAEGGSRIHKATMSRRDASSLWRQWINTLVLITADLAAFLVAAWLFRVGRTVPELVFFLTEGTKNTPVDIFYIFAAAFIVVRYIAGDYTRRRLFWDRARATTLTLVIVTAPCLFIDIAFPGRYSLFAEIASWSTLFFAIPILRHLARVTTNYFGLWAIPTAIITSSERLNLVYTTISNTLSLGCDVCWVALDGDEDTHEDIKKAKLLRLGDPSKIASMLLAENCAQAVVAIDDKGSTVFADLIQRLLETGISVSFIPSLRRLPLGRVTTNYFFGKDILLFQIHSSLQSVPSRLAKRAFDLVGSLTGLILLSPLFLAVAIAIKRHDGGPIFYAQKRIGRHGELFRCLKFRTMAVDADERLKRWRDENPELYKEFAKTFKLVDDPRVTGPGKWLRASSLDELPQLVNVLLGDMSLVGPRPVVERELVDYYGSAARLYKCVRPGLTGLWQISGRSDTTYEQRVVYDEWYILNWTLWYDLVIVLQTVWIVMLRRGAY